MDARKIIVGLLEGRVGAGKSGFERIGVFNFAPGEGGGLR